MEINLDFETRARINLKDVGPRRYAIEAEALCMAYAVDLEEPVLWLPGDPFPEVFNSADTFVAHNAGFERAIWEHTCVRLYGWPSCPTPLVWDDTAARAALAGLPQALGMLGQALGLPEEEQKFKRGKYLIQRLCKPKKDGTWNEDPELLKELYGYCLQDVKVARKISTGLPPMPYREKLIWALNEEMNNSGVPVDVPAAEGAVKYLARSRDRLNTDAAKLSGGSFEKVTQVARVISWLRDKNIEGVDNLQVATVEKALSQEGLPPEVKSVLEIRQSCGLASVKKFNALVTRVMPSGRVCDTLRYHGAGTGRWTSVGLQVQNLKRPELKPGKVAEYLKKMAARKMFPGVSHINGIKILSNCVRGVIQAEPGHVLVSSDYSQIELRVLLWLAEDEKNLQEIREGLDPYKTMAAKNFRVLYEDVTKDQRQRGKAVVLGCGFQLGGAKFQEYALGYGLDITAEEAMETVDLYRTKYKKVVSFWYDLQKAVMQAIRNPGTVFKCRRLKTRTIMRGRFLEIMLPSGRPLRYYRPRTKTVNKSWGPAEEIRFEGIDTYTRKWGDTSTYGGKLVENVTQGFARDVMAGGLLRVDKADLNPFLLVHDEIVCHTPGDLYEDPLEVLNNCLLKVPAWAKGLPLDVEGWTGQRYRK